MNKNKKFHSTGNRNLKVRTMSPLIVANSKDYELHQDDNIITLKHPSIEEFWFAILYMFKFEHQYTKEHAL